MRPRTVISLGIITVAIGAGVFIASARSNPQISEQPPQSKNQLAENAPKSTPSDLQKPSLTIAELGVRIQLNDAHTLTYKSASPSGKSYESAKILIKDEYLDDPDCQISVFLNKMPQKNTITGSIPRKLGNSYFNISTSPEYCGTNPESATNKWRASIIKQLDPNEGHYTLLQ